MQILNISTHIDHSLLSLTSKLYPNVLRVQPFNVDFISEPWMLEQLLQYIDSTERFSVDASFTPFVMRDNLNVVPMGSEYINVSSAFQPYVMRDLLVTLNSDIEKFKVSPVFQPFRLAEILVTAQGQPDSFTAQFAYQPYILG